MICTEYGLIFEKTEIVDQYLLQGLPEADYMRFNLFTIRLDTVEGPPHFVEP